MGIRKKRHEKRKRSRRSRKHQNRHSRLLRFESLENRLVLATFTPTTVAELIADINTANTNGEADNIDLDGDVFTLTTADNGSNGLPVIAADGGNALTIENGTIERDAGAPDFRLLEVATSAELNLDMVTIRGGRVTGADDGGGIFNRGTLSITDSTIDNNTAVDQGGGIYSIDGDLTVTDSTISGNSSGADGGGIYSIDGDLTVTGSTVSGNSASDDGGGIYSDLIGGYTASIEDSTISGNTASDDGGGIYSIGGNLMVTTGSTISGNTASDDGGGIYSIYDALTVTDSTISENSATELGGGIYSRDADVMVSGSTVSDNSAGFDGGGFASIVGSLTVTGSTISGNTAEDSGGGIFSFDGDLTVTGGTVSENSAGDHGAGIYSAYSDLMVSDSTISGNSARDQGGGIYSIDGDLTVSGSTISGNSAGEDGGGIYSIGGNLMVTAGSTISGNSTKDDGGGIYADLFGGYTASVEDSTISGNTASDDGGGIYSIGGNLTVTDSTISGNSASDDGGGIYSNFGDLMTITGSKISGNSADELGGGIYSYDGDVMVDSSEISGNSAGIDGGGIISLNGDLTVTDSTVSGNSAGADGGGIYSYAGNLTVTDSTVSGNSAGTDGGGIYSYAGNLTVTRSTISGNSAGVDGGGIYSDTNLVDQTTTITNSTVSGNTADNHGGGIVNWDGLTIIRNSTITANMAGSLGSGVASYGDTYTSTDVKSSIIAGNSGAGSDVDFFDGATNSFTSSDHNLIGTGNATGAFSGASDQVIGMADPGLVPLSNNGGPTQTHALLPSSPALHAGDAGGLTTDQRGAPRDDGSGVDVGAYELHRFFIVNVTGDGVDTDPGDGVAMDASGDTTLRAAIEEANALANISPNAPDTIFFDIPGGGPHTIMPGSGLPGITEAVIIDATSEPDFSGMPVVEIDGTSAGASTNGLSITAGGSGSTILGLAVYSFDGHGIVLASSDGNTISGNHVGTDTAGSTASPNGKTGIFVSGSENNQIDDNLISGNTEQGVRISSGSTGNTLRGNLIGTNKAGTGPLGNLHGISIVNAPSNVVGGTGAGDGNVISGNDRYGVQITGASATGNRIEGNFIGADVSGTGDLGNGFQGIVMAASANGNLIGGATSGAGNVISGNERNGLYFAGGSDHTVQGNIIGLDVTGTADLGNTLSGLALLGAGSGHLIGGTASGAGNVISRNGQHGMRISGSSTGIVVQGNLIGTDIDGTSAKGNTLNGINIINSSSTQIGGTAAGAGNVLSDNRRGVLIQKSGATDNVIAGNLIGTDIDGTGALGNNFEGIRIIDGANTTTIGGTVAAAGNVIANNGQEGVALLGGTGNAIRMNSMFANGGLGIDLNDDGVTANDADDPDSGANNLQNFPEISSAAVNGSLEIEYLVDSTTANSAYDLTVEFFLADADSEEGMTFLGQANYPAGSAGDPETATIDPGGATAGDEIVATATDSNGNTSEFSAPFTITAAPLLAAGGEAASASSEVLTTADVDPLLDQAIAGWVTAGIGGSQIERLENLQVGIADLSGARLGEQYGNTILLDVNAAGYGWFIDPTPSDDSEFFSGTQSSTLDSQHHVDLLTVIYHEMGHALGLEDDYSNPASDNIMNGWLPTGTRRLPSADDLDALFGRTDLLGTALAEVY